MHKFRGAALAALCLALAGCAASIQDVKDFSGTMQPGDGVLVIVVNSEVTFRDLRLTRPDDTFAAIATSDLPRGRTIRFVELPAGQYQWVRVDLSGSSYVPLNLNKKRSYQFTVKPGVMNYPGDFVVQTDNPDAAELLAGNRFLIYTGRYYMQLIDRNAMMLTELTPDQKKMLDKVGLVYTGPGTDEFEGYFKGLTAQKEKQP